MLRALRLNPADTTPEGANALVVEISNEAVLRAAIDALRKSGVQSIYTAQPSLGGPILVVTEGYTAGTIKKAREVINAVWREHYPGLK
jgi:hypothetical protein